MSIMWKYLDKRSATIAAIKDFDSMRFIIESTQDEVDVVNTKMISTGGSKWDSIPSIHNPKAQEDKIINNIDEVDILLERYNQALQYMAWFQPAWKQLTDEEQYILKNFYSETNSYGCSEVNAIADHLNVEALTVYKRKNRALSRLTVLLFGRS